MSAGTVTETTTVQSTIISALDGNTSAGSRIFYGTRLQTSTLPALTFEITAVEAVTIGGAPESSFAVTFNAVAETPDAALLLAQSLYSYLALESTWKVVEAGRPLLVEPVIEGGEESGLYVAPASFTLYA